MTTGAKDSSAEAPVQPTPQRRTIEAEPADVRRAEQRRAMVTTPESYHDERIGGPPEERQAPEPVAAERLLAAERLAAAERLFELDSLTVEGEESGTDPSTFPDPSTLYEGDDGGDGD